MFNKDSIFFNLFLSVVESSKWKQLPGRLFMIASICLILHVWFVFIFPRTLYWLLQSSWTWLSCARFVSESSSKWLVIMNSSLFTQSSPFSVTFWRPHLSLKALQLSTPSSSKGTALKTYSGKNSNIHGFFVNLLVRVELIFSEWSWQLWELQHLSGCEKGLDGTRTWGLGPASRKSRELFGSENPVVKLQTACFENVIS